MKWLTILSVIALAACGVDGPPERPTDSKPNVSITGEATFGAATQL